MPPNRPERKAPASMCLTIDASVLRAAGPPHSVHPVGAACRDLLRQMLDLSHRAAVCPDLLHEWKQHSSHYARTWLRAMYARGRIDRLQPAGCADVRAAMSRPSVLTEAEIAAAEKDMHLIAIARAADGSVLSLDDAAAAVMRKLSTLTRTIADLLWINPATDAASVYAWLVNRQAAQLRWRLDHTDASQVSPPQNRRRGGNQAQ